MLDEHVLSGRKWGENSQPRLTLVIYKMSGGGAQRVLSIIANHFAEKGWAITLMTFDDGSQPSFYKLHPSIQCVPLSISRQQPNALSTLLMYLLRPIILRSAIRKNKPDVVISFIDLANILTLVATVGLSIPVIISERVNPAFHSIGCFWSVLRKMVYRWAACLVVQTRDVLPFFSTAIQKKINVIPNPVLLPARNEQNLDKDGSKKILLAMGRLVDQKGFDLLIKAFAKLKSKFPEWQINIWGEGEKKTYLENLCKELSLQKKVIFKGMNQDNYTVMKQADIFVLSSRYEGFPNVLAEAMACGLPVISFDCPSGPSEMIVDGKNGLLISKINDEELAKGIQRLMMDESLAKQLGKEAKKVTDTFSMKKIMNLWEKVILEIINNESKK
ncbi:MAG: glycosyltransferase family 4 protein [Nitrospinae bacterium]|nr:glycosyltransferase family 4 protein [Nitrospinota bacterium]